MIVYLAGPIAGRTDEECRDWRETAKNCLRRVLAQTRDPMDRDYRGVELENVDEIVNGDKKDIRNSDVVLAFHPGPSTGTDMEIFFAWQLGIPVVAVVPPGAPISPWLKHHTSQIAPFVELACEHIITTWSN